MSNYLLNEEIVAYRREMSKTLRGYSDQMDQLNKVLSEVSDSGLSFRRPPQLEKLIESGKCLKERIDRKLKLFENGMVTVAIAGVEKSGKTTMIKELTGIKELPTADERCTSTSCELVYVAPGEKESFDVVYHSQKSLLEQVIALQWKFIAEGTAKGMWVDEEDGQVFQGAFPNSIEEFLSKKLPSNTDCIESGSRIKYKDSLEMLNRLQTILQTESRDKLGKTEFNKPLEQLIEFASGQTRNNLNPNKEQPLVSRLTVKTSFEGGSPSFRIIDTPGIDDPNPQARTRTYKMIEEETDFLIVLNRPSNTPSITVPLAEFLGDLKSLDKDSPLISRSVFLTNWHQQIDPDKKNAQYRIDEVKKEYKVFPDSSLYGPCDVTDKESLRAFMKYLNDRLQQELPQQDQVLFARFDSSIKDFRAEVRIKVLQELKKQQPPLPKDVEAKLLAQFDDWFDDEDKEPAECFLGRLRTRLVQMVSTQASTKNAKLQELQKRVWECYSEEKKSLMEWHKETITLKHIEEYISGKKSPIEVLLPKISEKVSYLVQQVTNHVEELGPIVQNEVMRVVTEALGEANTSSLCGDGDALTQISTLRNKLKDASEALKDDNIKFIVDNLSEFADMSMRMDYIMRYELRPSMNLLDIFRWQVPRRELLIVKTCQILEEASKETTAKNLRGQTQAVINELKKFKHGGTAIVPSEMNDPADKHKQFLDFVTGASVIVLETLLSNQTNELQEVMLDFLAQASQGLGSQAKCKKGWKRGLQHCMGDIKMFQDEMREVQAKSRESLKYRELCDQLEALI